MTLNFTKPTLLSHAIPFLICILLSASFNAFSQGKFVSGYVISSRQDTLNGLIRYEEWDESPTFIDFKKSIEAPIQKLDTSQISEFYISTINERFIKKRIGIISIDLDHEYIAAPSLIAKDSASTFLRVLVNGRKASLLEQLKGSKASSYFVNKNNVTTELINYPFYRIINGRRYLIKYDEYKTQLPVLLSDWKSSNQPIPGYSKKALKKYIEEYNEALGEKTYSDSSVNQKDEFTFDVYGGLGLEGWKEPGLLMENKLTYGVGLRMNLPRKFHNRYFRINFFLTPGASTKEIYNYTPNQELTFKTLELGSGTHFGSGKFRPYAGLDYSFPLDNWRSTLFGPHFGFSFLRQISLEISHFGNFNALFSEVPFFNKPRISLNYFLNLNSIFKKK